MQKFIEANKERSPIRWPLTPEGDYFVDRHCNFLGNIKFFFNGFSRNCREEVYTYEARHKVSTINVFMDGLIFTDDMLDDNPFVQHFVHKFSYMERKTVFPRVVYQYRTKDPITTNWDLFLFRCAFKYAVHTLNKGRRPEGNWEDLAPDYESIAEPTIRMYKKMNAFGIKNILNSFHRDVRMANGIVSLGRMFFE